MQKQNASITLTDMQINLVAVALAALSAFFIGSLWYTFIFAKSWQKLIGTNSHDGTAKKPNFIRLLIVSFILEIIMAFNLAFFIGPNATWLFGLFAGIAVGFGWVSLAFGVNYMFEGKSLKLWLINAGYNTVIFAVMGTIIGAMQ